MRGKRAKEIRRAIKRVFDMSPEVPNKAYQEINVRIYKTQEGVVVRRGATVKLIDMCVRRIYQLSKSAYKARVFNT